MMHARAAVLLVTTAVLVAANSAAHASGPAEQLRHQIDRVLTTLRDPELRRADASMQRRRLVRAIAHETFDFAETARRALGRHWQQRSAGEREEFIRLFTRLLDRAYLSRLDLWNGETVVVTGESVEGGQALVRSRVVGEHDADVPVDYHLIRDSGGRWRVWDVDVAGVSLVANYRTQFNKVIQTSSFDGLLGRLRDKSAAAGEP